MATSATVRVDKATSDLLLGPDWTMNMEICDSINSDPGLAKEAVKAVKKRLQHKIPRVQFLALTLLETMIKNCGDFIHFQVVERDILQEMVKIVRKKSDMEVREKILVLLESWQEAFGGPAGKYPQYFWAYTDLKRFGVDFPSHPSDATLMFTSPTHQAASTRAIHVGRGMPSDSPMSLDQAMSSENATLSLSDLDRIRSVMELLNDMLKAVNPHDPEVVKDEVIKDLVEQCRDNQKKILQLIDSTGDEELLCEGLALNDNLQNLLAKHDAIASGSPFPQESSSKPVPVPPPIPSNIFKEEDEEDDENDEFTQLARRNATALPDPPPPVKTTAKDQSIIDLLSIAMSSNSPQSHTPITPFTPSSPFGRNGSADAITRIALEKNPESPWAETQLSSLSQDYGDYPPPPWEDDPSRNPNPFIQFNSFGVSAANPPSATADADAGSGPTGPGAAHKPFVPSYRLFEDLVDASDFNGVLRTSSSSGQGMTYSRK